ncbi:sigma-70 family RNA polymerase sigma factor [Nocardioides donggukensis]|uniref:Sigma-70 family RNA polymerase sigma factor n=1 Tax=Nocardioides donggukensis TaxID=2774019 RepID=A0A927K6A9_9ACTN|nr:sigma-70 family RNA polymerase sigma factor [Nocardioides donggukensis]MBD8869813.1 sigma-70 family RNA polymerase sigma factor [Nocardioides donggukensis]
MHPTAERPSPVDTRPSGTGTTSLPRAERITLTDQLLHQAAATDDPERRQRNLDRVVLLNMGVARSLAGQHRGKGVAQEDLEQVAYLALVRAAARFDPGRDRDFLSYAVPTVRGELKKHFRDAGWMVRPPRRTQEIQSRVIRTRDTLRHTLDRTPSTAEIAAALGEPEQAVLDALTAEGCFHPTSLDRPVGDESDSGTALGDLLALEEDRDHEAAEARLMLRPVVRRLRERDRRILALRFYDGRTQQEIADELGVTQMQVSRLLSRILRNLRDSLEEPARVG